MQVFVIILYLIMTLVLCFKYVAEPFYFPTRDASFTPDDPQRVATLVVIVVFFLLKFLAKRNKTNLKLQKQLGVLGYSILLLGFLGISINDFIAAESILMSPEAIKFHKGQGVGILLIGWWVLIYRLLVGIKKITDNQNK